MEKDLEVGRCLSDDKRYADLLNGLLFEGRQRVQASDLQEVDSRSFLKRWSRKKSERYHQLRRVPMQPDWFRIKKRIGRIGK